MKSQSVLLIASILFFFTLALDNSTAPSGEVVLENNLIKLEADNLEREGEKLHATLHWRSNEIVTQTFTIVLPEDLPDNSAVVRVGMMSKILRYGCLCK